MTKCASDTESADWSEEAPAPRARSRRFAFCAFRRRRVSSFSLSEREAHFFAQRSRSFLRHFCFFSSDKLARYLRLRSRSLRRRRSSGFSPGASASVMYRLVTSERRGGFADDGAARRILSAARTRSTRCASSGRAWRIQSLGPGD
eukprot:scaffold178_cov255-Pinguiococcus_pyrenoidosus.AAC.11